MVYHFGEPVTIRLRRLHYGAATLGTALMPHPEQPTYLGMLIEGVPQFVPIKACHPWACPTCGSTKVWWRLGLGEVPVCARCVRMPREVYLQLWEDACAHALVAEMGWGYLDEDFRVQVQAQLQRTIDEVVASGDASILLKFATCRYLLRRTVNS